MRTGVKVCLAVLLLALPACSTLPMLDKDGPGIEQHGDTIVMTEQIAMSLLARIHTLQVENNALKHHIVASCKQGSGVQGYKDTYIVTWGLR